MAKQATRFPNPPVREISPEADLWVAPAGRAAKARAPTGGRLTLDLGPELHRAFKLACVGEGEKMIEVARAVIEAWTRQHGQGP